MKTISVSILVIICAFGGIGSPAEVHGLRQVQTISLPDVEGRIDHMAVDVRGLRLFVSALDNDSLEVVDLAAGKRKRSIRGLHQPQGVSFVAKANKLFVASAEDGTCRIYDATSFNLLGTAGFKSDADNLRFDARDHRLYVGYGDGGLGILDVASGNKISEIALGAHPESFQLEKLGRRIFVNLPAAAHSVAVVDRMKHSVVATWQLEEAANFPMALDETDHRLFLVTRKPAHFVVLNTESGKVITTYSTVGDADDLFYDAAHRRLYISGGDGFVDIFDQRGPEDYQRVGRIATGGGARTSLFVPEMNRLYVAVPHRGNQKAEIRAYELLR